MKRALEPEPITCKAMVAFGVDDLQEREIVVAPPRAGEVRVRVLCNALCHTDVYTLSGADPEGLFPSILGHEATAIVESIGIGVTSVAVGDTVVPGCTPQCKVRRSRCTAMRTAAALGAHTCGDEDSKAPSSDQTEEISLSGISRSEPHPWAAMWLKCAHLHDLACATACDDQTNS